MGASLWGRVSSCLVDVTVGLCFTRAVWPPHYLQVTVELGTILKDRDGGTYQVMKGISHQGFLPACSSVALCPLAGVGGVWFDDSGWKIVPF